MSTQLTGIVAANIQAINGHDIYAFMATFTPDAYVNDNRRQITGADAIRRWAEKEIFGDDITIEPVDVTDHYGETIVNGKWDGAFDKTNLPDPLIMASYYRVSHERVVSLTIINNKLSEF